MNKKKFNELTPEEKRIIIEKGTEPPGSGKYIDHKGQGTYLCRQCNEPLYRSDSKFDSHCGWPSFDTAIEGKVRETLDKDGRRMEITCKGCGGHLGHVFVGERMTNTNTRHCVNSMSMQFTPDLVDNSGYQIVDFAMGHFWIGETVFAHITGVQQTHVGYMGGWKDYPTREEVRRGDTGHHLVIRVVFDPKIISYQQLLDIFFVFHDVFDNRGQGEEYVGFQYTSAIFYESNEHRDIAQNYLTQLEKKYNKKPVTRIKSTMIFWRAENYHQHYRREYKGTVNWKKMIEPVRRRLVDTYSLLYTENESLEL